MINSAKLRDSIEAAQWSEAVSFLEGLDSASAAHELVNLFSEQQQDLFRHLPLDVAAAILPHFRYYDQYVLLHSLPASEMKALVDKLNPDDRMRFFDELPEETWQRLMDELSGAVSTDTLTKIEPTDLSSGARAEASPPPEVKAARLPERASQPVEIIIEARRLERRYKLPDGKEVEVIAPMDLA